MFVILSILILSAIIIIHEFGHFLAAKSFGVGVLEYSIGMGPVIFSKRIGETVYSLRLMPIGGYCAMYGEQSMETADKGTDEREKRNKKSKSREAQFKTDWTPERSFKTKTKWQQLVILIAGPFSNFVTAFLIAFVSVICFGAASELKITDYMLDDNNTCIAKEAGLEVGDVIVGLNDRRIVTNADWTTYKNCYPEKINNGFTVTVKKQDDTIESYYVEPNDEGMIGVYISTEFEKKHGADIFKYTGHEVYYWIRTTVDSLHMLLNRKANISDMSGVVGTTSIMNNTIEEASKEGVGTTIRTIFSLFVFISINIGFMNLIPMPALDGGRALLVWIEGALNKELPARYENIINALGMCVLLIIMVYTTFNDILRIISQMM